MPKRSGIPRKPSENNSTNSAVDTWVQERVQEPTSVEKMKRLTIDVPESLHRQLKLKSVAEGKTMADLVRGWIEEKVQ